VSGCPDGRADDWIVTQGRNPCQPHVASALHGRFVDLLNRHDAN